MLVLARFLQVYSDLHCHERLGEQVSKKGEVSYTLGGLMTQTSETTLEVTELPVGKWTQQYKEFLEAMRENHNLYPLLGDFIGRPFVFTRALHAFLRM